MREGGSYIVEKDGSLKLVQRTQPAVANEQPQAAPATETQASEVTDEDQE